MLAERCAHRGASLYYGFVEPDGVRCAYHGWKYAPDGKCIDQPFEPNARFKQSICQRSYPVQRFAGLLFAYLGSTPAPLLPRWDVLVRDDGERFLTVHPVLNANWLAPMENAVDTVHTHYLHGHSMKIRGSTVGQYYLRPIEHYEFVPFEHGILKRRTYGGDTPETELGHPLLFPNMLRNPAGGLESMHWRVPIDDEHTQIFVLDFKAGEPGASVPGPEETVPVRRLGSPFDDHGEYHMTNFPSQDAMAYETAGAIFDRTTEHLGASDRGIVMFRRMLREQLDVVAAGGEPMNALRDPERNQRIDFVTSKGQSDAAWQAMNAGYWDPERDPAG